MLTAGAEPFSRGARLFFFFFLVVLLTDGDRGPSFGSLKG